MLSRVLSSLASLAVAVTGVLLVDCSSDLIDLAPGDPWGVCSGLATTGIGDARWIGLGLVTAAVLALAATWVPSLRPGHVGRMRAIPEHSLNRNLGRLAGDGPPPPRTPLGPVAALEGRVEAVETAMVGQATPTREVTERWMGLLRELNELHSMGRIDTGEFTRLNTRLLDLFSVSADL